MFQIPVVVEPYCKISTQPSLQYLQGPQGDPFAPQPPQTYLPIEPKPLVLPRPVKKKRRPRRETECSLCEGDDSKNREGDLERMISCAECGRSGQSTSITPSRCNDIVSSSSHLFEAC